MGIIDKRKKAAGVASAVAAVVSWQMNDVHHEVESVRLAGIPLFKRDAEGNPRVLGIKFRRRKAPRAAQ